ncbi:MAG TPA: flagellar hook-associated protein FlgL [Burkholderiaceae bacterium]|nr:flagellar hook-associated protein FlgL [Burkholderiaceae bacterium]
MIRVSTADLYLNSQNTINADQSAMMTTTAELSSGKQINSPADNPVGAGQAALLQSDLTQLGQYKSNQAQATGLLNNASSTVTQALNVLQTANTTLVQAGNGTLNDSDRSALAAQLQQDLDQLVGLANTSDGQGGYLFGGSVNSTPPFVQNGNTVTYVGDSLVPGLQISQTRSEQVKYSGASVFMSLPSGNGTFATAAASTNTGTGAISTGSVTNPSALTGDQYTITIQPGATTYTITQTPPGTTGAPLPLSPAGPTSLPIPGMQVTLSGAAQAGDTFTISPSTNQSIFSVLASAISALQTPTTTPAAAAQVSAAVTNALAGTQQGISSLSTTQASMGAQLAELNTYATVNSDQALQDQTQMSAVVDLNYAQGASQLAQQQTEYQAALQSYAAISKLSLFNYI